MKSATKKLELNSTEYYFDVLTNILIKTNQLILFPSLDRAFSFAAPHLWNSLPLDVRSCATLDAFKSHVKTYLFSLAFDCN